MAKVTIVYYSSTGHTWQIARAVEEGARGRGKGLPQEKLAAARFQGQRISRFACILAEARA